jgi:hypothetical protein
VKNNPNGGIRVYFFRKKENGALDRLQHIAGNNREEKEKSTKSFLLLFILLNHVRQPFSQGLHEKEQWHKINIFLKI